MDLKQFENVTSISGLIWICIMPSMSYSTGSSVVIIFKPVTLIWLRQAYKVVVLPEPVGPVTRIIPLGFCISCLTVFRLSGIIPSLARSSETELLSRILITTLSP